MFRSQTVNVSVMLRSRVPRVGSLACGLVGAGLVDSPSMGRRIQKASLNFPSTSRPGFNCAGYLVKPGLRFR